MPFASISKSSRLLPGLVAALVLLVFHVGQAQASQGYTFADVRTLVQAGKYDDARKLVSSSAVGQFDEVARAFTEALILEKQGQLQAAADQLEKIVLAYLNFDRVRQELAQTYFLMGENEHAKYQFEQLAATNQSPAFRSVYNRYIDLIDSRRPWTLDGYLALAPSTNINGGVSSDTVFIGGVPLTPGNKKQSGIGVNLGGTGTYRFDLSDPTAFSVGASFDATKYKDKDFDEFSAQIFSELSHKIGDWRFGIGPTIDRTTYAWEGNNFGYGVQGSIQKRVGTGGDSVRITSRVRYVDYDRLDTFDGTETTLGFRYQHAFSPSLLMNIGSYGSIMNARADFNAYRSIRPFVEVYTELPFGMLGNASVSYEFRNYIGKFPWTGENRQDRQLDLGVGVTLRKRRYKGIAPRMEYHFVSDNSNVDLYDFKSHSVGLYLTKNF